MNTVFTSGQLAKLISILEQEGVTHEHFQRVLESGVLGDIFDADATLDNRVLICEAIDVSLTKRGMLFFTLDWPFKPEELFEKTGCYCPTDRKNIALANIPEVRLPILARSPASMGVMGLMGGRCVATRTEYEAKIFKFPRGTSLRTVRRRMHTANWNPAGHEHLLGLLAAFPMGSKPIDPVGGNKLIAPAGSAVIAGTLAGPGGANRAMWKYTGEDGHYGPAAPVHYLGVREY